MAPAASMSVKDPVLTISKEPKETVHNKQAFATILLFGQTQTFADVVKVYSHSNND